MKKIYDLMPMYTSQKSFYGKAKVIEMESGEIILQSYDTFVASIKEGKVTINGFYSNTTLRHIKEFLKQNGFEVGSKKELEKMYMQ